MGSASIVTVRLTRLAVRRRVRRLLDSRGQRLYVKPGSGTPDIIIDAATSTAVAVVDLEEYARAEGLLEAFETVEPVGRGERELDCPLTPGVSVEAP
jgi:hypothetical protein